MSLELTTAPIAERFKHILGILTSERFQKMEGLGKEVPFFICPYDPKDALDIDPMQEQLIRKLSESGIKVLDINLYDLTIEILKTNGDWEDMIEIETEVSKAVFKEQLQSILEPQDHLVPEISRKMEQFDFDIMFLSGVGEVFPYIRSHNVLNNLQSAAKEKPTLIFFPGSYTHTLENGASLDLFGRLHDDKYYRAFNIYNREV